MRETIDARGQMTTLLEQFPPWLRDVNRLIGQPKTIELRELERASR